MDRTWPMATAEAELERLLQRADEAVSGDRSIVTPPLVVSVRPFVVLDRFEFDRSSLRPFHLRLINRIAQHVVASWGSPRPIRTIRLEGHTDSSGPAQYNLALGQRRALAVQRALSNALERLRPGLARQIDFVPQSLGEMRPVASSLAEGGRARNRRVEIFPIPSDGNGGHQVNPTVITWVQSCLNQILQTRLPMNGILGPETRSTIRSFQQRQGLVANGLVSPQTVAALMRFCGQPRIVPIGPNVSLNRILLSATRSNGQFTTECTFQVSINGSPFVPVNCIEPGRAFVDLPSQPRPLLLTIQVIPATPNYWGMEGHFEYRANGHLVAINAPAEFRPPQPVNLPGQGVVVSVITVLSRVRDATARVLQSLAQVPASRQVGHHPIPWPPTAWNTPSLANHHYMAAPPVIGSDLNFDLRTLDPDTTDVVLEVAGVTAPKLIAVSWPAGVARMDTSGPTPFLIYFHPNIGQNVGAGFYVGPGLGTYPFGWDFLFYGLWRYLNYMGDPLTVDPFAKGLPYQISASGKNVVLVLPCNKVGEEVGVFLSAAAVDDILREIQAFMFRRVGVFSPPELGRTALGSFSAGNGLMTQFLGDSRNRTHSFYLHTLKELYMFEAPGSSVANWVSQAMRWASAGSAADKMIRAYTRGNHAIYTQLLGTRLPGSGPFVLNSSPSGLRTAAALPDAAWARAASLRGAPSLVRGFQESHQLISAMMLTDALRRSGF